MAKMTDTQLKSLVAAKRTAAVNYLDTELAKNRREALKFYRGDPLGNEEVGMSQVVSRDTMEAIESMLPGLVKPFVSGDEVVRYEPTGAEDEDGAKQSTAYVNYLFTQRNPSFRIIYDSMKDGLLSRLGVAKVVREEYEDRARETYEGLSELQVKALMADKSFSPEGDLEPGTEGFNITGYRTATKGKVCVYVLAPDEFLFERQLANLDDATFLAHRTRKTVSALIEMGLPKDKCLALSDGEDDDVSQERIERHEQEGTRSEQSPDPLTRFVWVTEAYVRVDYDGDGWPEWRRIITGGAGDDILLNEEVDDHPFVAWTPVPIPHRLVGLSIHDLTRDLALIKTGLWREMMNNLYLSNRPRQAVLDGQVNMDDLLSPKIGSPVRVKTMNAIETLAVPFVAGNAMSMIEYTDTVREQRTGSTRYNQGMDADSLNKTATGISAIMGAATQRLELIARQYAEQFLKPLFKRMLELVCKYPDEAQGMRLLGEWKPVDPRGWHTGYDMSVTVGLGTGNRDQMVGQLTNLLMLDEKIIQLQGGAQGPIVTLPNIYEKLKRMVEAMGLKGIENYYSDPQAQQQMPQAQESQVDPLQAIQAEAQAKAQGKIEEARINALADIEIAKINAEKDLIIAGMRADAQLDGQLGEAEPEAAGDEPPAEMAPAPQPAPEPQMMAGPMPEMAEAMPQEMGLDPMMGGELPQAPMIDPNMGEEPLP